MVETLLVKRMDGIALGERMVLKMLVIAREHSMAWNLLGF